MLRGPRTEGSRAPRYKPMVDKLGMGVVVDVEKLKPGNAWLAPLADATAPISVTKVAIAHLPGQSVELTVNGKKADPLGFDGVDVNGSRHRGGQQVARG